jgi:hypothetical protein
MSHALTRAACTLLIAASLNACGLAETAATGAAGATSEVEQARQAQHTEQQVRENVEAAQQTAADKLRAADAAANQ